MSFDGNIDRYLFMRKIATRDVKFQKKCYSMGLHLNCFENLQCGTEITYF